MVWLALAVLVLGAAATWVRRRAEGGPTAAPSPPRREDDGIDRAELEAAERDVREMDADGRGRPLEDAVGDDWGPGTPKSPMG